MSVPSPWASGYGSQSGLLLSYDFDNNFYYATNATNDNYPATQITIHAIDNPGGPSSGAITGFTNIVGLTSNFNLGNSQYLFVADVTNVSDPDPGTGVVTITNTITRIDLFTAPTYTRDVVYTLTGTAIITGLACDKGNLGNPPTKFKLFVSTYDSEVDPAQASPSGIIILGGDYLHRYQPPVTMSITVPNNDRFNYIYICNDTLYAISQYLNSGLYSGLISFTYNNSGYVATASVSLTVLNSNITHSIAADDTYIYALEIFGARPPRALFNVNAYNIADGTFSRTIGYSYGGSPFILTYPDVVLLINDIYPHQDGTSGDIYQYSLAPPGPSGPSGSTGPSGGPWSTNPSTGYNFSESCSLETDGTSLYFFNGPDMIGKADVATGQTVNQSWANVFDSILVKLYVSDTNLYVSDIRNNAIWAIDTTSQTPTASKFIDYISGPVYAPAGMVISNGYMYVANNGSTFQGSTDFLINKIDMSNISNTISNWITFTSISPECLCVHNNTLYIGANSIDSNVAYIYTADLTSENPTPVRITTLANYEILDIKIDTSNNAMYISGGVEQPSNYIQQLDLNGTVLNATWQTQSYPAGLSITGGYLYCADYNNYEIYQYELTAPPTPPPPSVVCFKEGSKILTDQGYRPIEDLRKGDLVKTALDGYKAVEMIGKRDMNHLATKDRIKDQLYRCSSDEFPEVFEDLMITGCHSILVDDFVSEQQKNSTMEVNGNIYITGNKYRLPACVDGRTKVYEVAGTHTIYHIALENDDYYMNYGVYANGLLVETCSRRYLKELSNMTLVE